MFIFRKDKALSDSICESFIQTFETCPDHYKHRGVVSSDKIGIHQDEKVKTSTDITFNPGHLEDFFWGNLLNELIVCLNKAKMARVSFP